MSSPFQPPSGNGQNPHQPGNQPQQFGGPDAGAPQQYGSGAPQQYGSGAPQQYGSGAPEQFAAPGGPERSGFDGPGAPQQYGSGAPQQYAPPGAQQQGWPGGGQPHDSGAPQQFAAPGRDGSPQYGSGAPQQFGAPGAPQQGGPGAPQQYGSGAPQQGGPGGPQQFGSGAPQQYGPGAFGAPGGAPQQYGSGAPPQYGPGGPGGQAQFGSGAPQRPAKVKKPGDGVLGPLTWRDLILVFAAVLTIVALCLPVYNFSYSAEAYGLSGASAVEWVWGWSAPYVTWLVLGFLTVLFAGILTLLAKTVKSFPGRIGSLGVDQVISVLAIVAFVTNFLFLITSAPYYHAGSIIQIVAAALALFAATFTVIPFLGAEFAARADTSAHPKARAHAGRPAAPGVGDHQQSTGPFAAAPGSGAGAIGAGGIAGSAQSSFAPQSQESSSFGDGSPRGNGHDAFRPQGAGDPQGVGNSQGFGDSQGVAQGGFGPGADTAAGGDRNGFAPVSDNALGGGQGGFGPGGQENTFGGDDRPAQGGFGQPGAFDQQRPDGRGADAQGPGGQPGGFDHPGNFGGQDPAVGQDNRADQAPGVAQGQASHQAQDEGHSVAGQPEGRGTDEQSSDAAAAAEGRGDLAGSDTPGDPGVSGGGDSDREGGGIGGAAVLGGAAAVGGAAAFGGAAFARRDEQEAGDRDANDASQPGESGAPDPRDSGADGDALGARDDRDALGGEYERGAFGDREGQNDIGDRNARDTSDGPEGHGSFGDPNGQGTFGDHNQQNGFGAQAEADAAVDQEGRGDLGDRGDHQSAFAEQDQHNFFGDEQPRGDDAARPSFTDGTGASSFGAEAGDPAVVPGSDARGDALSGGPESGPVDALSAEAPAADAAGSDAFGGTAESADEGGQALPPERAEEQSYAEHRDELGGQPDSGIQDRQDDWGRPAAGSRPTGPGIGGQAGDDGPSPFGTAAPSTDGDAPQDQGEVSDPERSPWAAAASTEPEPREVGFGDTDPEEQGGADRRLGRHARDENGGTEPVGTEPVGAVAVGASAGAEDRPGDAGGNADAGDNDTDGSTAVLPSVPEETNSPAGQPAAGGDQPGGFPEPYASEPTQAMPAGFAASQAAAAGPPDANESTQVFTPFNAGEDTAPQDAALQAFWFAVPEERTAHDEYTGQPMYTIVPGTWFLALEDQGSYFKVRHDDGREAILHNVRGIQRG